MFTSLIESSGGIKYAVIDNASSGDNTLVAAVTGKKIVILGCVMVAAGAVNVRFERWSVADDARYATPRKVRGGSCGLPPFSWTPKLRRYWRWEVFYDEAEAVQAFQFRVQARGDHACQ